MADDIATGWTTGQESSTDPKRSHLETRLRQAGEHAPADLDRPSKAEASRRIDQLQESTGRGQQLAERIRTGPRPLSPYRRELSR